MAMEVARRAMSFAANEKRRHGGSVELRHIPVIERLSLA
jgi:hypothetical protein